MPENIHRRPLALILKFTRDWTVKPFFKNFNAMKFKRSLFDLYVHVGMRERAAHLTESAGYHGLMLTVSYKSLRAALDREVNEIGDEFHSFRYTHEDDVPYAQRPPNFTHASTGMLLYLKDLVKNPLQVHIEDDVLPPIDGIKRLLDMEQNNPKAAFFSIPYTYRRSVPGRGFHQMSTGVQSKMKFKGPLLYYKECADPKLTGVHEIEGSHFGFFLVRTDVWKHAFDPILRGELKGCYLGDDGVICHGMRQMGHKLMCDFDAWCGHMQAVGNRYDNDGRKGVHIFTRDMATKSAYYFNPAHGRYDVGRPGITPGVPKGMSHG